MNYGKDVPWLRMVILSMIVYYAFALMAFAGGDVEARAILKKNGYTNEQLVMKRIPFFQKGCGIFDSVEFLYRATNAKGTTQTVRVCHGYVPGSMPTFHLQGNPSE